MTATDQDFVSLYLAKRFLAPTATYVCADVESPSPFPDGQFDAVHCLDAFHYFRSKKAIVSELRRVVRPNACWIFPHLHNSLAHNVTAGIPLSPEHYARCFGFLSPVLLDEADLLSKPGRLREARIYQGSAAGELRSAQSVAVVGAPAAAIDASEDLATLLCNLGPALRVNPIYRGAWKSEGLDLRLHWPNERLRDECRAAESILPQQVLITPRDLAVARSGRGGDDARVRDLVSRFVLVPLPPNYGRRDLAAHGPAL